MRAWMACLVGLVLAFSALAAPVDPAERDAVLAIYRDWNKAVAAGQLNQALALRTAAMRTRIAAEAKTPAQQKRVLDMLKAMVPDTVEVLHAARSKDGAKVTLVTEISATVPPGPKRPGMPAPGTKLQAELTLDFLREGKAWKFDNQTWGMDPSKVKPCAASFPGMDAFEERDTLTMGGQIRRVAFAADHTLLVIRMFDEENCIFLPPRARLAELGFNADTLAPWAIIEIQAWPHRDDKQVVWAEALRVQVEE